MNFVATQSYFPVSAPPNHLKMNRTKVQNPPRKLDVFGSVLTCAKSAQVFQKLALRTLSLSFLTNISSSDSKVFLCFIVFSAVHRAFLFFDAKAWPQSQTDLFTCTTVLHCGHTFLRRIDPLHSIAYTVGIPF